MPLSRLDVTPAASVSGSPTGTPLDAPLEPLSPSLALGHDDDLFPPSPAANRLFYARSDDGSPIRDRSSSRPAEKRPSPAAAAAAQQDRASPTEQQGAPLSAKGKARLAAVPSHVTASTSAASSVAFQAPPPPPLPKLPKKAAAKPKPRPKVPAPAIPTTRGGSARGRDSKVSIMTREGRYETIRRGVDGLFACKSCTRFCTKSADKMHAHYTLCVTGPFEDPVPSDASFAEPSPDEESSATESDDDYQRRVKTTARPTDRKKASRAAKTTATKTEKGVTPVKKEPAPRRRSEKAIGISRGSRVGKRRKAEEAVSTPAVSTSSVLPAKRKLPAAPVPTTARPRKRRNATPSSTPPPARSSAGRAPEETTATDGELHLEGKVVRVKGKTEKILVDRAGDYFCVKCRTFWHSSPAVVVEHSRSCTTRKAR